jgi:hypothetical protein
MTRAVLGAAVAAALASWACSGTPGAYDLAAEPSPDGRQVALVRVVPCGRDLCESLWVGASAAGATRIVTLPHGQEHCDDIAWSRDGARVAFLVNGYQLRVYDARTHAPAGLLDLLAADGTPTSRVARGITFSDNGAAVTFDDCPRDRSGCRPGMAALR